MEVGKANRSFSNAAIATSNVSMGALKAASDRQEKAIEITAMCAGTDYETFLEYQVTMGRMEQLMHQRGVKMEPPCFGSLERLMAYENPCSVEVEGLVDLKRLFLDGICRDDSRCRIGWFNHSLFLKLSILLG